MRPFLRLGAVVIFFLIASFTRADSVYSNFFGDFTGPGAWGVVWHADSGVFGGVAAPFTVPIGMSYRLDSVTLALAQWEPTNNVEISIFLNNGAAPGGVLETLGINPAGLGDRQPPVPATFTSSLTPVGVAPIGWSFSHTIWTQPIRQRMRLTDGTPLSFFHTDRLRCGIMTLERMIGVDGGFTMTRSQPFASTAPPFPNRAPGLCSPSAARCSGSSPADAANEALAARLSALLPESFERRG